MSAHHKGWALVATVFGLVAACAASLMLGGRPTSPDALLAWFTGATDPYLGAVFDARSDRTVLGVLCGSALAVSGQLVQGITRNPLGDPGLLGITVGAGTALVTVATMTGTAVATGPASVWIAFVGGAAAAVVVLSIGTGVGSRGIVRLVLTGAVVSAVLTAWRQALVLANPSVFDSFRHWVVGALSGRDASVAIMVAPTIILGLLATYLLGPALDALALGDDVATSLGTRVPFVRAGGILVATLLAASATAAAGPIAFVGLVVPHLTRTLVGHGHRSQMPLAAVLGATLLVSADTLGRVVSRPGDVMVGIVTAVVGAPFLLVAVRKGVVAP